MQTLPQLAYHRHDPPCGFGLPRAIVAGEQGSVLGEVNVLPAECFDLLAASGGIARKRPGQCVLAWNAREQVGELARRGDALHPIWIRIIHRDLNQCRGILGCFFALDRPAVEGPNRVDDRGDSFA